MPKEKNAQKSFIEDLRTVLAEVRLHTHLGVDLREALVDALEHPKGGTFRKAMNLVDEEYKRLGLARGHHSVARLRTLTNWLSTVELGFICDGYKNRTDEVEESDKDWKG